MARVIDSEIRGIIESDPDISMVPFIAAANDLVDWLDTVDEGALSTTTLTKIEKWLSAHFYAIRDQQYTSKSTGGASGSFQGQTGMVLLSTYWGQMACTLDTTGLLAQRSKEVEEGGKRKAQVKWLGTAADSTRPDERAL